MPYLRFLDAKRAILIGFSVKQKKELIMTTSDGGKTWDGEIVAERLSRAYLSPDGKFLTLFDLNNIVTVLQHQ